MPIFMKTFQMTNPFTHEKEEAVLKVSAYASDPAVMAVNIETPDGTPLTTATVNLGPDAGNQVVMPMGSSYLDTNNNPAIAQDLEDAGIAEPRTRWGEPVTKDSGFAEYPLYDFDMQKLAEYDPEGVKTYQDGYQAGFEKALPEVIGNAYFNEPDDEEDEEETVDPVERQREMADRYNHLSEEEYDQLSDEERSDLALAAQEEAEDCAWERSLDQPRESQKVLQKETSKTLTEEDAVSGQHSGKEEKSEEKPKKSYKTLWVPYTQIETKEGKRGKFDEVSMPQDDHIIDSLTVPHKKNVPDFTADPSVKHKDIPVFLRTDKPVIIKEYDQDKHRSEKLMKSADEVIDMMKSSRNFENRLNRSMSAKAAAKAQANRSLAKEKSMMSHDDRVKAAEQVSSSVSEKDSADKQMVD